MLPVHIHCGPRRDMNLSREGDILTAHQANISQGMVADQVTILNRSLLLELCPSSSCPIVSGVCGRVGTPNWQQRRHGRTQNNRPGPRLTLDGPPLRRKAQEHSRPLFPDIPDDLPYVWPVRS